MRYGFYLPTRGELASAANLELIAGRAEEAGFHSTMISDHIVTPTEIRSRYPYTATGVTPSAVDSLEQLSLMAFIAAKTTTLRLVSSVMILPYRNPVVTAKMLATIDVLSGGRVTVGVGVGWMREEVEALDGPDFDRRGAASDEYIAIMKKLWSEDPASHAGEFYSFDAVRCLPQPVQKPHPPIWIGGNSRAALRRAARIGDGWHPVGANPASPLHAEELAGMLDELRQLTRAAGRNPEAVAISYKAPTFNQSGSATVQGRPLLFSGGFAQTLEDVATLSKLGVSELVFDVRSDGIAQTLDRIAHFARVIDATKGI